MDWLRSLWKIKFYALFALLIYGGFLWSGLHGSRWLGSDDENTENLNGNSHTTGTGGRNSFYHK
ncbi:hypothetical protein [Hymenobacter sp. DG01]|uniref:hypothetical protein n=1 Tax=Hymenobacter sp. DG01 TaxID=2584940 RepID=UPI0011237266|nr:hypothetical protein [Hymenobacter sp. DG01]